MLQRFSVGVSGYFVALLIKDRSLKDHSLKDHSFSRGGLMVSALGSSSIGTGSSPGWGHSGVFLGRVLYFHSASLHPGV